jgi:2-iminobutanoate/2-iminopropanoate deaminase
MGAAMAHSAVHTAVAPTPGGAYSQGIDAGFVVVTAGQVGMDPETGELAAGVVAQTERALNNVAAILRAADLDWSAVIKTTCFLSNIADFAAFNDAYARIVPDPKPARSTVGVALAGDLLVEIEALAVRRNVDPIRDDLSDPHG